jgi:hypothetical protein
MDGRLTIENGSIYDLLFLFSVNRRGLGAHPLQQARAKLARAAPVGISKTRSAAPAELPSTMITRPISMRSGSTRG